MKNRENEINGIVFSQRAKIIFSGAFLGLFLSKGLALIPGFALDDYLHLSGVNNPPAYIGQGRFSQAAIQLLLNNLGVSATSIAWPSTIIFFVAAAISITLGILIATRSKGSVMSQAGIAAIIGSHPYLTEYLSYRQSIVILGASFVLLAFVLMVILNNEKDNQKIKLLDALIWLAIPLLVLAGTIQTTFVIGFFFIVTRFVIDSATLGGVNGIRQSFYNNSSLFIAFLFSAAIYAIVFVLMHQFSGGQNDGRASLISIADIPVRIKEIGFILSNIFILGEPILSSTVKLLLLATIIGFTIKIGFVIPRATIGIVILFIALTVGSIFFVSISSIWWPVPRAIYGIGFSFGLTLTAISIFLDKGQKPFLGIILTIALGFIFHSNAMLYDQLRTNRWDLYTAGALAQDLVNKGVRQNQNVFLILPDKTYPAGPNTAIGDLNISAFSITGYTKYLMREATGRDWNIETVMGTPEICPQNLPLWPSPESIQIFPQQVFVCMGHPKW